MRSPFLERSLAAPGEYAPKPLRVAEQIANTNRKAVVFGRPHRSTSDWTASSSSGTAKTKMTCMVAPRRVREKAEAVVPQLYEQDKLSERCGQSFSTLSEAISVSLAAGFIDAIESKLLQGVRKKENVAKHENFRHRSEQQ